jgi:hypothetical protein
MAFKKAGDKSPPKKLVKPEKKVRAPKPTFARLDKPKVKQIVLPGLDELNIPSNNLTDYTILLYGTKGVGKTSALSTFPKNLIISWEPKRRNIKARMYYLEVASADKITDDDNDPWMTFVEVCRLAIADPTIETICVDTADLCYEACQEHICRKYGILHPSDKNDFGKSWNDIKQTFTDHFSTLISSGKTLVFTSHAKEREQEMQDGIGAVEMVGPSCAPACLKIMKQLCDFWLFYGYNENDRTITVRDESRTVAVGCGYGFFDTNGKTIEQIKIPDLSKNPKSLSFYNTLDKAFKGSSAPKQIAPSPKRVARKLPK